ncbi:MAG: efflux RND transporter periplasmic adaptor subunit [Phycisphaeraceae bacterium]|nr:MAG: efflux RND transporter periplasmic adaptor subunit [Phycisphaeraceae bacterium]
MKRAWIVAGVVAGVAVVVGGVVAVRYSVINLPGMDFVKSTDPGAAGGGGDGGGGGGYEPSESVELVDAAVLSWQPTADLVGTVFAVRSVTVQNELAGVVRTVGFTSGDVVEAGRVLIQQDDTVERADLAAAEAAVRVAEAGIAQAEVQVKLAEVELARIAGADPGAVAAIERDRATTRLDAARAERTRLVAEQEQSAARAGQVRARLEKMTIRAPFRARAGMRNVHEGQYLAEGAEVVSLQELTPTIYLDFAVPQEYVPLVRPGTTVMATGELLGPEPVGVRVVAMDSTVNRETRNVRVRSEVDNARGVLTPGMSVRVRVPIESPQSRVSVPSTAVRRTAYASMVFVVAPDAKGDLRASQRVVTLGRTVGDRVIVLDGLREGERVAGAGAFKLRDGVKVVPGVPGGGGSARAGDAGGVQ